MSLLQCQLHAAGLEGVDGYPVHVEVSRAKPKTGVGRTTVVGLPDHAVRESIDRVTPALYASGLTHAPTDHLVINLAPADRRKEGPAFDLPIALGLAATDDNNFSLPSATCFCAELALDGSLRPVRGILAATLAARDAGLQHILVAPANANEAAAVSGIAVHAPANLQEAIQLCRDHLSQAPVIHQETNENLTAQLDYADVRGQEHAKRALCIAAAGGHNVLMVGPPGSGKTMLARRLPSILPPLSEEESLDVSRIHSIAGLLDPATGLAKQRPFRSPHHNVSAVGLIGGGSTPRPGEVSLAHHGVLFLDELPEFPRTVLESLRQPLEDGELTISRSAGRLSFPSKCMLVAAMNPCPCGYLGHPTRSCTDSAQAIHRYRSRISGPLLDRIDIHIEVPAQKPQTIGNSAPGESSARLAQRVQQARSLMVERQGGTNAQLSGRLLRQHALPTATAQDLLHRAVDELGLSARAYDRICRVARTIADIDQKNSIDEEIISEAIGYRLLDRSVW